MRTNGWLAVTVGLGTALFGAEALACGGCFGPPPAQPTDVQVVTDHRMVLSLAATQTTLWDQFEYSGRPAEFSWILPIRYTTGTHVAIADDAFLNYVNTVTAPLLVRPNYPFTPCPGPPYAGGGNASFSDAAVAGDVTVLAMQVVGPYAVSIIRGSDPTAITSWLRDNGYTVPDALRPVIEFYTTSSMDFVALRLRPPTDGIYPRMQPVRVSMDGYVPTLPLRMIAAGVADHVGLALTVFASSRIEAANFPNGELSDNDLTWDWTAGRSEPQDFLAAFNALNATNGRRLWLSEVATHYDVGSWSIARSAGGASADAGDTAPTDPMDDVRVITSTLSSRPYVTRLRADLPAAMLDRDLTLQSSDRAERVQLYHYGHQLHVPSPPVCPTYPDAGSPRYPDAASSVDAGGPVFADASATLFVDVPTSQPTAVHGGLQCDVRSPGAVGWRGSLLGLGALALAARRRRRG